MIRKVTVLYAAAWVGYVVFSVLMFPKWNISTAIPMFVLVGTGAWLYGTTGALGIVCGSIVYHIYLLSFVYADLFETYQTKLSSPLVLITISYVVGRLRKNYNAIRALNRVLDQKVSERTERLSALTDELLRNSENLKISRGEELHDGIGQQLTGIQLLTTSLHEHLLSETNPTAALTDHLRNKITGVHMQMRSISRLLFPVRINQVGLSSALQELAASINELKRVDLRIQETARELDHPAQASLQLYRICQETVLYAIDHLKADKLTIDLSGSNTECFVRVSHNGIFSSAHDEAAVLLRYRLARISGTMKRFPDREGKTVTEFRCSGLLPHEGGAAV